MLFINGPFEIESTLGGQDLSRRETLDYHIKLFTCGRYTAWKDGTVPDCIFGNLRFDNKTGVFD